MHPCGQLVDLGTTKPPPSTPGANRVPPGDLTAPSSAKGKSAWDSERLCVSDRQFPSGRGSSALQKLGEKGEVIPHRLSNSLPWPKDFHECYF